MGGATCRRVDHDLVAEDEPERAGLVHQPLQRSLRQRVARVSTTDVGVRADKPALLHVLDRTIRRGPLPVLIVLVQNVGSKSCRCSSSASAWNAYSLSSRRCVSRNRYLWTLPAALATGRPREPTVSQTPTNLIFVGREYFVSHCSSMDASCGNGFAISDLIVEAP